jgi:phosphatidylglycerol:prolipoprotein diacylglycerol transferase
MLATITIGIDPIAFQIGSLAVHWYGIMYVVAFVAAYYLGARPHAVSHGIAQDHLERLIGWGILFGLIGARLYYDVQNLSLMHSVVDVIAVWNGGMAFYGAIIGGLATLVVLGWRWKLPIWVLLDGGAFFAVVGQPIGRIGNIINGDILGGQSNLPWATAYTNPHAVLQAGYRLGVAYQPAAAYEALGTLVILLILLGLRRRGVRPGVVILSYVGLYSVSQFLLDFLRQTEPVIAFGLKELQLTAIATLVVGMPLLAIVWRRTQGRSGEVHDQPVDAVPAEPGSEAAPEGAEYAEAAESPVEVLAARPAPEPPAEPATPAQGPAPIDTD